MTLTKGGSGSLDTSGSTVGLKERNETLFRPDSQLFAVNRSMSQEFLFSASERSAFLHFQRMAQVFVRFVSYSDGRMFSIFARLA